MARRKWWVCALMAVGLVAHFGTAALRVQTFFPYPKLLDFSAFYVSARALRQGLSPYGLSEELLRAVQTENDMPFRPPPIYNPPIWPWLLQPLASVDFVAAAYIWLLIHLVLLAWVAVAMTGIAGYENWRTVVAIFLGALTFGPVFLDLTLGQTSVILLALSVAIGRWLRPGKERPFLAAIAMGVAAGAKLFPLVWLGAPALLRRWRMLVLGVLATLLFFGLGFLVAPQGNWDYWFRYLPERITSASGRGGLDDQSLVAWLDRLGRSQTYSVPGINAGESVTRTWDPPWSVGPRVLRWSGYLLSALLGLPVLIVFVRIAPDQREGGFYLWVLYALLIFPHVERYNHALLLPAMAWLWGQGERQRLGVVLAYVLTGLSRLNHLWVMLLPVPWGPLASGFGTCAVLLLVGSMFATMWAAYRHDSMEVG
jgi:hypothetical protein